MKFGIGRSENVKKNLKFLYMLRRGGILNGDGVGALKHH